MERVVLLVEDDDSKRERVANCVLSWDLPIRLEFARSRNSALLRLVEGGVVDLLLLDMTLPTFDVSPRERGGRMRPFGGKEIMRELKMNEIFCPTILVTQLDTFGTGISHTTLVHLVDDLRVMFPEQFLGYVRYSSSQSGWREQLRKLVTDHLPES